MQTSKIKRNKNGFTIIEVLITAVILLLTAGAFLTTYWQCANISSMGRGEDIAINAATSKMEEIADSNFSQIMNYNGQSYPISGLPIPVTLNVVVSQVTGMSDLFTVTITATWQQGARNNSRTLTTTLVNK